jgi:hypothetical protein
MSGGYTAIGTALLNVVLAYVFKKFYFVSSSFAWTPVACFFEKTII